MDTHLQPPKLHKGNVRVGTDHSRVYTWCVVTWPLPSHLRKRPLVTVFGWECGYRPRPQTWEGLPDVYTSEWGPRFYFSVTTLVHPQSLSDLFLLSSSTEPWRSISVCFILFQNRNSLNIRVSPLVWVHLFIVCYCCFVFVFVTSVSGSSFVKLSPFMSGKEKRRPSTPPMDVCHCSVTRYDERRRTTFVCVRVCTYVCLFTCVHSRVRTCVSTCVHVRILCVT